jgi:hypothetical protein
MIHRLEQQLQEITMPFLRILVFALLGLLSAVPATAQADKTAGLFINLTTDDTWAAAKAINFAHERVLKSGHKPVAIWLNVRAVISRTRSDLRTSTDY